MTAIKNFLNFFPHYSIAWLYRIGLISKAKALSLYDKYYG